MARLLPSSSDAEPSDESRVVGLDDDAAGELIEALSSETTRAVLAALHDEPGSPSEVAARVDTSLQNVQYHLEKLEDAGLVEVGDTVYSEKGREMNVYVPADRALVVVAGGKEETSGLRAALSRLLGGIGVLGIASVVVDRLARRGLAVGFGAAPGGASGGDGGGGDGGAAPTAQSDAGAGGGTESTVTPTPTPTPTEVETATETVAEAETVTETVAGTGTATDGGVDIAKATTTTTEPTEAATTTPTAVPTEAPTQTAEPTSTASPAAETTTPTPIADTPVTVTPTDVTTALETTANAPAPGMLDGLAVSPGLLFFLGGSTVLVGGFVWWWVRS